MSFVAQIFVAKFCFEISFFADDDETIDQNKPKWSGEQSPDGIAKNRNAQCPKSEPDVHRVSAKSIQSTRNNFSRWIKRDWISPGTSLRDKPAKVQRHPKPNAQAAEDPARRPVNEICWDQPFNNERSDNRKY